MTLPYSEKLNISPLNRIFDNKSECYKLFWFQAIMHFVIKGQTTISYDELVNEMITDAWYMVTEYHLNLGPNDTLEKIVLRISEISELRPTEKKENIINFLSECDDPEIKKYKQTLILNVPYRIHSPFLSGDSKSLYENGIRSQIETLNTQHNLIYYFSPLQQLNTEIYINGVWADYLKSNHEIILGWIRLNMAEYLQRRNPSVPGILDKLSPPAERKLEDIKKYWKILVSWTPVNEIYENKPITSRDISIDHFVPWSYVAHDELWNLHPTTKSINSSKGNRLPDWDRYFLPFTEMEYLSYKGIHENHTVREEFEKVAKYHLNNEIIKQQLYKPGQSIEEFRNSLFEVVNPIYLDAVNCGFNKWVR